MNNDKHWGDPRIQFFPPLPPLLCPFLLSCWGLNQGLPHVVTELSFISTLPCCHVGTMFKVNMSRCNDIHTWRCHRETCYFVYPLKKKRWKASLQPDEAHWARAMSATILGEDIPTDDLATSHQREPWTWSACTVSVRGQGTETDGYHPQTYCTAHEAQGPAEASAAAVAEVRCGHLLKGPQQEEHRLWSKFFSTPTAAITLFNSCKSFRAMERCWNVSINKEENGNAIKES